MTNRTEGLLPWQPQKIYYASDAFEDFGPYWHDPAQLSPFRKNIMDRQGPTYETTTISPSRHVSYARLTVDQQLFYQTQEAGIAEHALKSQNLKDFEYPARLIFGKSVVGGSVTGDVFQNVSKIPVPFVPAPGYQPQHDSGLSLKIGDPWRFYSLFWKAHDLEHLAQLVPVPEAAAKFGDTLPIPMLACNNTTDDREIAIAAVLPAGWTDDMRFTRYPLRPGECYPVQAQLIAPKSGQVGWREIQWNASAGNQAVGNLKLRVYLGESGGLPQ